MSIFKKLLIAGLLIIALFYQGQKINDIQDGYSFLKNRIESLGAFNVSAGGTYRLQSSAGLTDTSIYLSSFKEPISNLPYTMTYLNSSIEYGTLDPANTTNKEFISFTGITQNSDGSAILTGVSRGLSFSYPFTASTTLQKTHSGQSIFILSNAPQVYNQFANRSNNDTISGTWTFSASPTVPTPTGSSDAVSKAYVDGGLLAGAATATESVTGIVRLATQNQMASSTPTTADIPLVLQAQNATSTPTSHLGKYLAVTESNGYLNQLFLNLTETFSWTGLHTFSATTTMGTSSVSAIMWDGSEVSPKFGGNGSDGALNVTSGTTTIDLANALVVEKNYSSISVCATCGLEFSNPNALGTTVVFKSKGNTTILGTVIANFGGAGGTGVSQNTGNVGRASLDILDDSTHYGAAGVINTTTTGGAGGAAGAVWSNVGMTNRASPYSTTTTYLYKRLVTVAPGAGGGAGGANNAGGRAGGNGGIGGGALIIETGGYFKFTGVINLSGAHGVAGDTGAGGGCGGGGGGAGGMFVSLYNNLTSNTGTVLLRGGNGGTGSNETAGSGGAGGGGGGGSGISGAGGAGGAGGNENGNGTNGAAGNGTNAGSLGTGGTSDGSSVGGGGGGGGAAGGSSLIAKNLWFF